MLVRAREVERLSNYLFSLVFMFSLRFLNPNTLTASLPQTPTAGCPCFLFRGSVKRLSTAVLELLNDPGVDWDFRIAGNSSRKVVYFHLLTAWECD